MTLENDLLGAIQRNDIEAARRLAAQGIGGDATLLHYAVQLGNESIVAILLESGANRWINSFDDTAFTPLMWAARKNAPAIVRLLLGMGADVNAHDESRIGNTALMEATEFASFEVVDTLLQAGANPQLTGWMQLTAIDKAVARYENSPTDENRKILKLFDENK